MWKTSGIRHVVCKVTAVLPLLFVVFANGAVNAQNRLDPPSAVCSWPPDSANEIGITWHAVENAVAYQVNLQISEYGNNYEWGHRTVSTKRIEHPCEEYCETSFDVTEQGTYWVQVRAENEASFVNSNWSEKLPVAINQRLRPEAGNVGSVWLHNFDPEYEYDAVEITTMGNTYLLAPVNANGYPVSGSRYFTAQVPNLDELMTPVTVRSWGSGGYEKFSYFANPNTANQGDFQCTRPADPFNQD